MLDSFMMVSQNRQMAIMYVLSKFRSSCLEDLMLLVSGPKFN